MCIKNLNVQWGTAYLHRKILTIKEKKSIVEKSGRQHLHQVTKVDFKSNGTNTSPAPPDRMRYSTRPPWKWSQRNSRQSGAPRGGGEWGMEGKTMRSVYSGWQGILFHSAKFFWKRANFHWFYYWFFKVFIDPFTYYLHPQYTASARTPNLPLVADCSDKPKLSETAKWLPCNLWGCQS